MSEVANITPGHRRLGGGAAVSKGPLLEVALTSRPRRGWLVPTPPALWWGHPSGHQGEPWGGSLLTSSRPAPPTAAATLPGPTPGLKQEGVSFPASRGSNLCFAVMHHPRSSRGLPLFWRVERGVWRPGLCLELVFFFFSFILKFYLK